MTTDNHANQGDISSLSVCVSQHHEYWSKTTKEIGGLRLLRASAVGAGLLGLAACGSQEQVSTNEPLRQIEIPADFTFSTTRAVTVTVSAGFTAIPSGAKLVVERGDGSVVYAGALLADRPLTLPLMVATADQRLVLRLTSEYREWQTELQVDRPQLSHVFTEEN